MKHTSTLFIALLSALCLLATRPVWSEPTDGSAPAKAEPASAEPKKCDRWEEKDKRLEALKTDLKLTPVQEAAWAEFAGKITGDRKGWEEKHKGLESLAGLPVVERMEKMLAFSKEHLAKQEARLDATKTFYATLSPEQRQVFDKGFNFDHHGGPGRGRKP